MKTVCVILNYNDAERAKALALCLRSYSALDGIVLVDNADHGLSYVTETERYSAAIHDLFNLCEKSA